MSAESTGRAGRRTGEVTTRDDILTAARTLFGDKGYKGTSLRAVATAAGVDVALISYYFGSKHGLFVEALEVPVDPAEQLRKAANGPRTELGSRLISGFTQVWEGEVTGPAMAGLMRSIIIDPERSTAFGDFATHRMVPLLSEQAEVSLDTARILLSSLFGMATVRYLVAAPAFADMTRDEVIALYGPRLQLIVDADSHRRVSPVPANLTRFRHDTSATASESAQPPCRVSYPVVEPTRSESGGPSRNLARVCR